MIHIEGLEIRYFRSVWRATIKDLRDITVFSGKNDVGKSNLLKALNLFFNNRTDWNTPFDFSRDFSKVRLNEVRKDTIRGKQYIQITVNFRRGQRYEKSLPPKFSVTRTWTRDAAIPQTRSNLANLFKRGLVPVKKIDRAEAALQRFLNTIRYEYVPAIKDHAFFGYMISRLQDVIFEKGEDDSAIATAVRDLNESVVSGVGRLKEEFLTSTNVPVDIRLPQELGELFRAFAVSTTHGGEEMPLGVRGDGIRCRFLPSLMHYISESSNLFHIWGFEEPENSLEHGLSTKLAHRMRDEYIKSAQILVTSHSPAFFTLSGDNALIRRITRDAKNGATIPQIEEAETKNLTSELEEELGLMEFQKDFQKKYETAVAKTEAERTGLEKLKVEIRSQTSPIFLVEGKWDAKILHEAWKKLFTNISMPFRLFSCDTTNEDSGEGSAGCGTLRLGLESVRADEPLTVGIFDRDKEGCDKGFKCLNKNFKVASFSSDVKLQKTGTAAAILLPAPLGREDYAKVLNLPLEFYFDDTSLAKQMDGKGLVLKSRKINQHIEGLLSGFDQTESHEPHHRQIEKNSKKHFAERVVPALPVEAFETFRPLFELIKKVFQELEVIKTPSA
jgi:predicted ATPase